MFDCQYNSSVRWRQRQKQPAKHEPRFAILWYCSLTNSCITRNGSRNRPKLECVAKPSLMAARPFVGRNYRAIFAFCNVINCRLGIVRFSTLMAMNWKHDVLLRYGHLKFFFKMATGRHLAFDATGNGPMAHFDPPSQKTPP